MDLGFNELSTFDNFLVIENMVLDSLESCKASGLEILKKNNSINFLKKSEVNKFSSKEYIQYTLDFIMFEDEIDEIKGNWLGLIISLNINERHVITVNITVHSVYDEKVLLNETRHLTDDLKEIEKLLQSKLNLMDQSFEQCLNNYFLYLGK